MEETEEDLAAAEMRRRIRELEADTSLSAKEKAEKRQAIMTEKSRKGKGKAAAEAETIADAKGALFSLSTVAMVFFTAYNRR